jgi:hypothetical protein
MKEDPEASVLTARRAAQHVRLSRANDAYEHLCILTLLSSLAPLHLMLADTPWPHGFGATLANVGPLSEGSNGLLPRRSNLVGYVRWDARSDRFPPCQTIIPTAFRSQSGLPRIARHSSTIGTSLCQFVNPARIELIEVLTNRIDRLAAVVTRKTDQLLDKRFNSFTQPSTTTICLDTALSWSSSLIIRKRLPSAVTS